MSLLETETGDLDSHARWQPRRLKTLCTMKSGTSLPADLLADSGPYPVFGANRQRGWTDRFTHEGEYPLVGRQGSVGKVRFATGRFWATEHAVVVTPGDDVDPSWLAKLLEVMDLAQYSRAAAIPGLSVERIMRLHTLLPPLDEQLAIRRFIDYSDLWIGRAVGARLALAELLLEKRGATVEAIVLGNGTDRACHGGPFRFIDRIPSDWSTRPAKFLFREVDERSQTGREELLSVSHLTGVTPRSSKTVTMFLAESYKGHKMCRAGDLVVNTMWAWMGALGVTSQEGLVSPAYGVYRPLPNSPLLSEFADLLLRSRAYVSEYTCRSTGIRSSRLRLYPDRFLSIPVVVPPITEQHQLVAMATARTAAIDLAIDAVQREVTLLREYRTRLVSDVVLGKRDVRSEAAALTDVDPLELASVVSGTIEDDLGGEEENDGD